MHIDDGLLLLPHVVVVLGYQRIFFYTGDIVWLLALDLSKNSVMRVVVGICSERMMSDAVDIQSDAPTVTWKKTQCSQNATCRSQITISIEKMEDRLCCQSSVRGSSRLPVWMTPREGSAFLRRAMPIAFDHTILVKRPFVHQSKCRFAFLTNIITPTPLRHHVIEPSTSSTTDFQDAIQ